MKSILDPDFQYTPADKTDLRKTFARVRREMKRQKQQREEEEKEQEQGFNVSIFEIEVARRGLVKK